MQATGPNAIVPSATYLNETIREMEQLPWLHPFSINIDAANFYYALTKSLRPRLIIEIGCLVGFSTLHFAQALREQGFGKIIGIDLFEGTRPMPDGRLWDRQDIANHYAAKANLDAHIQYVKGRSTVVINSLRPEITQAIDILYIDGDHTAQGAFEDWNHYYNDVRVGGYVLLHDIYPTMCGWDGPRILLDALRAHNYIGRHLECLEVQTRDSYGIAVLRKLDAAPLSLRSTCPTPSARRRRFAWVAKVLTRLFRSHPSAAAAPPKSVCIRLIDERSGSPISNATMTSLDRLGEAFRSNSDGIIDLSAYIPNRYIVDFNAPGYHTLHGFLLEIPPEDRDVSVTVDLRPL